MINNDSLCTVFTYLDVVDLLPLPRVSNTWRGLALHKFNTLPSLGTRDILDRCWMEQADIEILVSLCPGNLTRLDLTLNTFSAFKFYNLTTLFQFVGECVVLKHLLLSQSHEATVPTLSHMTLPSFLNPLQVDGS